MAQQQITNLMLATGVLPKAPDQLFHKVEDARPLDEKIASRKDDRPLGEIKQEIIRLVGRQRHLPN